MTTLADDGTDVRDRRRHGRGNAPVSATLVIGEAPGRPVPIARVVDVSAGGVLVELPMGTEPPSLHASGTAVLASGTSAVQRHARVVRVRFGGSDKGKPMAPALALAFDDADLDAAIRWQRMLGG